ncbi:permease [Microbacterium oryzae]|uniref:FtsX-like permease family protein n=1 Tax=Microbacterium oryzae TaxID=743009 RepID=UPI0025B04B39|nr:FtsX-like permease family protein [Microbacterium oryzae]MDN3311933.1 permease [Microbacterium oryzae]
MTAVVQRMAPPAPLAGASGRAPLLRLTWHLSRPSAQSAGALVLPAVAFAVATALLLTVVGGVLMFWSWPQDRAGLVQLYQLLSIVALAILAVPLMSLGGAAARLSARRRDDRLATLRLLGATPQLVTTMTVLESTAVAVVGAVAGVALHAVIVPLAGSISFLDEPIGPGALWAGPWMTIAVVVAVALVAAVSAGVGLRRVVISPLGVRTKQDAPRVRSVRAVIAVVVVVVAAGVLSALDALPSYAFVVAAVGACFAAGVGVLGIIGPWLIGVHARMRVKRAKTPDRLIAARTVLESPRAAWRQVGGLAMTTFVAVVGGAGTAYAGTLPSADDDSLIADIRTGVIITLAISFLMVACSVGVNQAAAILDRRALYVALDRVGMPRDTMEAARTRATMGPLLFTVIVAALAGVALVAPLLSLSLITAPVSVLVIAACIAGGILLVWLALRATRPVLTRVLLEPERAE